MNKPRDQAETVTDDAAQPALGVRLRQQRESMRLSTADVAASLRLTVATIEDLEHDQYDQLPPATFVRGYIKSYARLLDIDSAPLLKAFDGDGGAAGPTPLRVSNPVYTSPQMSRGMKRTMPLTLLLIAIVAIGVGATELYKDVAWPAFALKSSPEITAPEPLVTWADGSTPRAAEGPGLPVADDVLPEILEPDPESRFTDDLSGPSEDAVDAVPMDALSDVAYSAHTLLSSARIENQPSVLAEEQALSAESVSAATSEVIPAERPVLRILFSGASWIEVYGADGEQLLYGLINEGQSERVVTGETPFSVVIGDAGHVTVEYDGEFVDLGQQRSGRVARLQIPR